MLRLESELQESRLEVERLEQALGQLRTEVARTRDQAAEDGRLRADADMQRLVTVIGTPVVQLLTQDHLHRGGTVPVRVGDVLAVGARLVRALREVGVETVGETGRTEPYDPHRHDPLSAATVPAVGIPVTVRVVGLSYQGRIVRKAGVEPADGVGGGDGGGADGRDVAPGDADGGDR